MNVFAGSEVMEQPAAMGVSFKPGDPVPKPPKPRAEEEIMSGWGGDHAAPLVSVVCHTYNHEKFVEEEQ